MNPQQARISGIPFKFGERVPAQLTFVAYESGDYLVEVTQTNTRGAEIGGVEYRVSA